MNIIVPQSVRTPTLVHLLRDRMERDADRTAFVFLRYRGGQAPEQDELTFGELWDRSRGLARALAGRCAQGERALILVPPGLDYIAAFLGCQLAGVVAVPAYPPRNARHLDRLAAIAHDCEASVVLSMADLVPQLADWGAGRLPPTIAVDLVPPEPGLDWPAAGPHPSDLAFVQYTSGTTGIPKGVMVGHDNLTACLGAWSRRGFGPDDTMVAWLPPFHDLGLVSCILVPLTYGFRSVLMSPPAFLQDPVRWLRAMSARSATITMAPNFAYDQCCDLPDQALAGIDLSSLRQPLCGGEPVRPATLARFGRRFAPYGLPVRSFVPGWGMAETTLQVTVFHPWQEASVHRVFQLTDDTAGTLAVSNGPVIDDHDVRIVDATTHRELPPGRVGEIWVAGPVVARGYWNRPAETADTFHARLADDPQAGPFLRTGDLGALVRQELCIAGRIKELVIIGGRKLHPQDIEAVVAAAHPALAADSTIAFGLERANGEEGLAIVHGLARTSLRGLDAEAVFAAIRHAVMEAHDIAPDAIVLVRPATLPRTTSGKLQRLKASAQYRAGELASVAQWKRTDLPPTAESAADPIVARLCAVPAHERDALLRHWLAGQVQAVMRLPEAPASDVALRELGLDSLMAMELRVRLDNELRLDPPLAPAVLFEVQTVTALAKLIAQRLDAGALPLEHGTIVAANDDPDLFTRIHKAQPAILGLLRQRRGYLRTVSAYRGGGADLADIGDTDAPLSTHSTIRMFCSADYLDLAQDPFVKRAAQDAVERYGASVSAVPIFAGATELHRELEGRLARFVGCEDAVIFPTGHAANSSSVEVLCGPNDFIVRDGLLHASLLEGIRLSGAGLRLFRHNDIADLAQVLRDLRAGGHRGGILVAVEGVYGLDGDVADIAAIRRVAAEANARVYVDDSQGVGVIGTGGRGIVFQTGEGQAPDILMGAFSKGFGGFGGYAAGSRAAMLFLRRYAKGTMFSVGLPPAQVGAAIAAIDVLEREPERVAALQARCADARERLAALGGRNALLSRSPIMSVLAPGEENMSRLMDGLFDAGIWAEGLHVPATPQGGERVRFRIRASHIDDDISAMVDAVRATVRRHGLSIG